MIKYNAMAALPFSTRNIAFYNITLFKSITMICETENIPRNVMSEHKLNKGKNIELFIMS
jgi:hypothetical protein